MNKTILLCVLASLGAFAQVQTPLTVFQSAGSATGAVRLQERRTNGQDYVAIAAPQSIATSFSLIMPSAVGTAGHCLKDTDGAGTLGFAACATGVDLLITDYDWSQTPGGALTAATPATVTLTPCPAGVAPYTPHHSVGISGGTGAAESVLITAVSGSGATCDIEFTPANSHSGAWVIASLSNGEQEAINYALNNAGHRIFIPQGAHVRGKAAPGEEAAVYVQGAVSIAGANQSVNGGSEISLTHDGDWAYVVTTGATNWPVHFEKFAIKGTGLATGGGIKITATSTHNCFTKVKDMQFYTLPVGVWFEKACGQEISGNLFYGFTDAGLRLENTYDTDAGDQTVTGNNFLVIGASTAVAIDWLSAGGAKIIGNKFNVQGAAINATMGGATIITTISGNSFDNQKLYSVKLRGASGFLGAAIVGNVVTGAGDSGYIAFDIADSSTDAISNVVVADNAMQAAGTAIKVGDAANVSISGNVIGSFTTAIDIKATASGVSLGKNTCYSVTTCYAVDPSADVRSTSPVFASGYGGWAASGTNIASIAEFAPPATGEVNNAILFQTNTTGTNSQRGIWWDTAANMHFARFSSNRSTTHTNDLKLEADGDAHFSYNVGIGRTPAVSLDVNGVIRSSDGTIINQLYTSGGAAYVGVQSNHPLLIMQDNVERLRVTNTQLLPGLVDQYLYLGDSSLRFNTLFTANVDAAPSGTTGNYVKTRKFSVVDSTGSSGAWDWQAAVTASSSLQYWRDNVGDPAMTMLRQESSSPVNYSLLYTDLRPAKRSTGDGHTVTDSVFPSLGSTSRRWAHVWADDATLTDDLSVGDALLVTGNAVLSGASNTMSGTLAPGFSGLGSIGTSGLPYGAMFTNALTLDTGASTVGYVWTATSTGGAGSWQAPTTATAFADNVFRVQDNADATKQIAFEASGITTGTTRTVTVPNANLTMAGLNVSGQTFLTPQSISYSVGSPGELLTVHNTIVGGSYLPGCVALGSSDTASSAVYSTARLCSGFETAFFADELTVLQTITGPGTYQTALSIKNQAVSIPGTLTVTGNAVLSGASNTMSGTMAPGFDGLGSIGTSALRYGDMFGYDASFAGQVIVGGSASNMGASLEVTNNSNVNLLQVKHGGTPSAGSGGGIYAHLGSAPTGADQRLGFFVFGVEASGTQYNRAAINGRASQAWTLGSAEGAYLAFGTTASGTASRTDRWRIAHNGHFLPEAHNTYTIGENTTRPSKIWVVDLDVSGTCTGCGGGSAPPFADTTAILSGSVDATKLLRFEVDGFTTGTTRTLTPQNGNYTIAGTDFPNIFTSPQTLIATTLTLSSGSTVSSNFHPASSGVYEMGGTSARWIGNFSTLSTSSTFTLGGNIVPSASSTFSIGSSTVYPLNVYANYVEPKTELVMGSGVVFNGSLIPSANNIWALGNTSFRVSNVATVNANFSGTLTAPSGNTGTAATLSCGAGQAVKNITVSGGIVTSVSCGTP